MENTKSILKIIASACLLFAWLFANSGFWGWATNYAPWFGAPWLLTAILGPMIGTAVYIDLKAANKRAKP